MTAALREVVHMFNHAWPCWKYWCHLTSLFAMLLLISISWTACQQCIFLRLFTFWIASFIYGEIAILGREVIPCLIKKAIFYPMGLVNFWTRAPPDPPKYMHIKNLQKQIIHRQFNFFIKNSTNICNQFKSTIYNTGYINNKNPPIPFELMYY